MSIAPTGPASLAIAPQPGVLADVSQPRTMRTAAMALSGAGGTPGSSQAGTEAPTWHSPVWRGPVVPCAWHRSSSPLFGEAAGVSGRCGGAAWRRTHTRAARPRDARRRRGCRPRRPRRGRCWSVDQATFELKLRLPLSGPEPGRQRTGTYRILPRSSLRGRGYWRNEPRVGRVTASNRPAQRAPNQLVPRERVMFVDQIAHGITPPPAARGPTDCRRDP
jgi:hypothetical protein